MENKKFKQMRINFCNEKFLNGAVENFIKDLLIILRGKCKVWLSIILMCRLYFFYFLFDIVFVVLFIFCRVQLWRHVHVELVRAKQIFCRKNLLYFMVFERVTWYFIIFNFKFFVCTPHTRCDFMNLINNVLVNFLF